MSELGQYHINDMVIEQDASLTRSLIEGTFGRHQDTRGKISAEGQGSCLHIGGANTIRVADPWCGDLGRRVGRSRHAA